MASGVLWLLGAAPWMSDNGDEPMWLSLVCCGVAALSLAGATLMEGSERLGQRGRSLPSVLAAGAAALPFIASMALLAGEDSGGLAARLEKQAIALTLSALVGVAVYAAAPAFRALIKMRDDPSGLVRDLLAVTLLGLFIRYVPTRLNLLQDGALGLMHTRGGDFRFGGAAALLQLLLPESLFPGLVPVAQLFRFLSALLPVAVYGLGHALGLERRVNQYAGLAAASLPLHAALFSSEHEMGPALTMGTAGLALVVHGLRRDSQPAAMVGHLLVAHALWWTPLAWPIAFAWGTCLWHALPRERRWTAAMVAPVIVVAGTAVLGLLLDRWVGGGNPTAFVGMVIGLDWLTWPWARLFLSTALMPVWLWIPALAALVRRTVTLGSVEAIGLATGIVPVILHVPRMDDDAPALELFIRGAPGLPWLLLLAGEGVARWLVPAVQARWPNRGEHAWWAMVGLVAVSPMMHWGYLGRSYAGLAERPSIAVFERKVPGGCGLVVPEDTAEARPGEGTPAGMNGTARYYRELILGMRKQRGEPAEAGGIVPATAFLEAASSRGELPATVPGLPSEWAHDGKRFGCWYFLETTYCRLGAFRGPSRLCAEFAKALRLTTIDAAPVPVLANRLVTFTDALPEELHDSAFTVKLHRIDGVSPKPGGRPR